MKNIRLGFRVVSDILHCARNRCDFNHGKTSLCWNTSIYSWCTHALAHSLTRHFVRARIYTCVYHITRLHNGYGVPVQLCTMYMRNKTPAALQALTVWDPIWKVFVKDSSQSRATTHAVDGTRTATQEIPRRTAYCTWNNASRNKVSSEVELHNEIFFHMPKFIISSWWWSSSASSSPSTMPRRCCLRFQRRAECLLHMPSPFTLSAVDKWFSHLAAMNGEKLNLQFQQIHLHTVLRWKICSC